MMRIAVRLLMFSLLASLIACSGPTRFKVTGEIEGGGNTNLTLRYYGNNAVQRGIAPARDGKFEAEFSSRDLALVEILDNDLRTIGLLCLKNGDEINITINRANPFKNKISGNALNEEWGEVLNANADALASGDAEKINEVVERYIKANPENTVSSLLFSALYDSSIDPVHAQEVLASIDEKARIPSLLDSYAMQLQPYSNVESYGKVQPIKYRVAMSDSIRIFSPKDKEMSLIVISNENSWRADSVVPHIKRIHKAFKESRLQIFDIGAFSDTLTWKGVTSRDSAKWIQGWLPGGILGDGLYRLAIPQIPYYIVIDSTGEQLYRGPSPQKAQETLKELLVTS